MDLLKEFDAIMTRRAAAFRDAGLEESPDPWVRHVLSAEHAAEMRTWFRTSFYATRDRSAAWGSFYRLVERHWAAHGGLDADRRELDKMARAEFGGLSFRELFDAPHREALACGLRLTVARSRREHPMLDGLLTFLDKVKA